MSLNGSAGKRVFILEGPDGSGKTTLAYALVRKLQGTLVHHGSYLGEAGQNLYGIYDNSMDPALFDWTDVVLDRSWLSEPIYGAVMRSGANRLSRDEVLALEDSAAECRAVVVLCLPPVEVCLKCFEGRPQEEYLKKAEQLRAVWEGYSRMETRLPVVIYDRTQYNLVRINEFISQLVEGVPA